MPTPNDAHDGYGGRKDADKHKHRDIERYGGKDGENNMQQQYYSGEEQYIFDERAQEFEDTDEDQNNSGESSDFEPHTDSLEVSYFGKSKLDTEIDGEVLSAVAGSYANERTSWSAHEGQPPRPSNPWTPYFKNAEGLKIPSATFMDAAGYLYSPEIIIDGGGDFYHPEITGAEFTSPFAHEDQPPRHSDSREMFGGAKDVQLTGGKYGVGGMFEGAKDVQLGGKYGVGGMFEGAKDVQLTGGKYGVGGMFKGAKDEQLTGGTYYAVGGDYVKSPRPLSQQREAPSPRSGIRGRRLARKYLPGHSYPARTTPESPSGFDQRKGGSPILSDEQGRSHLSSKPYPQEQDAPKPKQGKSEMRTCWIAAEKALRHIQNNRPQIDSAFLKRNIQKSQYAVLAGFDESLIQDGIGYLEQVHIFTSADVAANSTLLADLGRILSPFPSILFTESSHPHLLPVFKPDGTACEFNEFLLETASTLADHGSKVAVYPTITSLSQTSGGATSGGTSGGSQKSSGPDNGQKTGDNTGNEGDNNPGKGKQQGDKKGKGREENPDNPGEPEDPEPKAQSLGSALGSVRFEVPSKLCLEYNRSHFQLLTVVGDLTIELKRHTECRVLFTKLNFGSIRTTPGMVYEQFFVHVALDSQDQRDDVDIIKPLQTLTNDKTRKVVVGAKSTRSILGSIATTVSLLPTKIQAAFTATASQTGETSTSAEQMENTFQINPQTHLSRASCAFNINDPSHKKNGTQMTEDILPTIDFEFFQDAKSPRASRIIDVEIKSHWSAISPNRQGFPWLGEGSEPLQTAPRYSNLCQSVALKIPSNLAERAKYKAELIVDLQNLDSNPHISLIVDSPRVGVTPRVSPSHSDSALVNTGM